MHINSFSYSNSKGNLQIRYIAVSCIGSLLVVALTLFWLPFSHAQTAEPGDIQGTVIDRKREKPLVAHPITLTIHKADTVETQETVTDESGNYRFGDLPLDPSVHYTVSTVYEGTDYTEKDIVLSTWAPNIRLDFDIGAFTDDKAQIQIKAHSFVIAPPPPDHAPDGAVTVFEAVGIQNQSDLSFQTKHGTQTVGLHLTLPIRTEGFNSRTTKALTLSPATNEAILTTPLPPGESLIDYDYVFHVEKSKLNFIASLELRHSTVLFLYP